jgi:Lar family restriction alleviation protein
MINGLDECPFCGSEKVDVFCIDACSLYRDVTWAVECEVCIADGPWGSTREEAELLWNTRI